MNESRISYLTLCPPLQVIRLLEDSGERAVRLREKSPFVSFLSDLDPKPPKSRAVPENLSRVPSDLIFGFLPRSGVREARP
jgi:hypothetical protein